MTAQVCSATSVGVRVSNPSEARPARWGGVFAMTLCVFALIASEFMPVSLLTPLASDLRVSEGLAGQGIAISGAFAVLTSLSIPALAGSMNRKTLLLGLTALMAVAGAVVALATAPFGASLVAVAILLGLWGLLATAAPVGWSSWIAEVMPQDAESGGGLMVAVIQLAIAIGSTVGGLLFDNSGYQSTFVASAGVLLFAAFLTLLSSRSQTPRAA